MKTTLDLPDDLLIEAKTLAARRKTILKAGGRKRVAPRNPTRRRVGKP